MRSFAVVFVNVCSAENCERTRFATTRFVADKE